MDQKRNESDVNRLKGNPNSQRADFYESRGENDPAQPQAGSDAAVDDESVAHFSTTSPDDAPTQRVTSLHSGAKREGFFKKRDFE